MPIIPKGIYRRTPWKNGGGFTEEIVSAPDLGWRISLATIEQEGPFSEFAGVDRTIVVLDHPIVLRFDDGEEVQVRPLEPFRFAGERRVHCVCREGAAHALNVMTVRALFRHAVRVVTTVNEIAPVEGAISYAFFLDGRHAGDTVRIDGSSTLEGISSDAALLVTIQCGASGSAR